MSYLRYVEQELAIAKGVVPGHYSVNKFGRATNADSGVACTIWDRANSTHNQPLWLAPTAARVHAIVSTQAADTATTGASARTIRVYGLTSWSTAETSEDISLNGTTPVNTANSYVIIHRMKVLTSGATSVNAGYITATAATDASVTAQINPTEGQTQMAIYGIPSTQSLYLTGYYASVLRSSPTGATANTSLLWTTNVTAQPNIWQVKHTCGMDQDGTTGFNHPFNPPDKFAGPGILRLRATATSNDSDVSGGFDLIVVDN